MLISIVVPIYNVERYLSECVESVIKQSYRDWELILVDDGSKDGSPAICDAYAEKEKRVKVVHKVNGGLVSARKVGLEVASGDYVMPLDGDDFIEDDCLEIVAEQIEKYAPDVICFGHNICSHNSTTQKPVRVSKYGLYNREDIEKNIFPSFLHGEDTHHFAHNLCGKALKRPLYDKYQNAVSSKIGMGEDGACTYPLVFNSHKIVILQECLYNYRQVDSSMTKVRKPLSWDNYDLVYQLYEDEIDLSKFNLLQQYYRARTHNLFNIVLSQFFSGEKYSEVVKKINLRFDGHPEYMKAIKLSNFRTPLMKLCRLILRFRLYFILFVISRNKSQIKRAVSI